MLLLVQKFERMIYQFLTIDNDRHEEWTHNIKWGICYDFDNALIFYSQSIFLPFWREPPLDIKDISDSDLEQIKKRITFWAKYIIDMSLKNISSIQDWRKEKVQHELMLWENLLHRAKMLNFFTLIVWSSKQKSICTKDEQILLKYNSIEPNF